MAVVSAAAAVEVSVTLRRAATIATMATQARQEATPMATEAAKPTITTDFLFTFAVVVAVVVVVLGVDVVVKVVGVAVVVVVVVFLVVLVVSVFVLLQSVPLRKGGHQHLNPSLTCSQVAPSTQSRRAHDALTFVGRLFVSIKQTNITARLTTQFDRIALMLGFSNTQCDVV